MPELKELMLQEPRWTLSVAESLTCGHVQAFIGAISGASQFFRGGITAYSLDEKARLLDVDRGAAQAVNSVSSAVAEQMARGVCKLFGTTLGAATTGYAEPDRERGVIHPFAWWAIHHASGGRGLTRVRRVEFPGASRVDVQTRLAELVVAQLNAYLVAARAHSI